MADEGWEGVWRPMLLEKEFVDILRDHAGQPVLLASGRPAELMMVNLRTGEFSYPAQRGGRN